MILAVSGATVAGGLCRNGRKGASQKVFLALFLLVVVGAAVLRLASLDNRPMHCDEAVHAEKFRLLLEDGHYVYDPCEFHGPGLNFLTLPIARLAGVEKLTETTETHLRLLPSIFGIVLVGLVWVVREELGRPAALLAALLTAVSPAMVFFSRYYIQEMLLVCFTFGAIVALWRYAREVVPKPNGETATCRRSWLRRALWLVLLGTCIGMMHASKETCVIPMLAIAVAAAVTMPWRQGRGISPPESCSDTPQKRLRLLSLRLVLPAVAVVVVAAGVSALFFSSFLDNPQGVVNSVATYRYYLERAWGEGSAGPHDQPWYHYFERLFWWQRGDGPLWTEASIAVLALVGLIAAAVGRGMQPANVAMARFLAVFTLVMTVSYSALPYKTPWCALGFLHGMILLAGVGAAVLIRAAPGYVLKTVVIAILAVAIGHLAWQAHRASFVACNDLDNPCAYSPTHADVLRLAEAARQIADAYAATEGTGAESMFVQVICPDDDYWPLPWYLRRFQQVSCSDKVPEVDDPATPPAAPLIITTPSLEDAMVEYAYAKPVPGQPILRQSLQKEEGVDWQLRRYVWLRVNVRNDLWDAYMAGKRPGAED